jgi:1-acyl-sn-glycerol-3-phosphate acyltransferase
MNGMPIAPTAEQLRALTPVERFNFKVTSRINHSPTLRRPMTRFQAKFYKWWIELGTSRTVLDHGFENFNKIDPSRGVLVVVNHRTFYDQFVIVARLFRIYGPHHSIYFPVRANFFYDNPLGLLVNMPFAMCAMYPPIVRDARRRQWNLYATDLMVDMLRDPQNMIGFHPEGTRNQGPDPYELLPAKPGCGELIYRSNPNVVPVFLQGFKSVGQMFKRNLGNSNQRKPLVHMVMGEPMDFSEALKLEASKKTYLHISRKVMEMIVELSQREREIRAQYEKQQVATD